MLNYHNLDDIEFEALCKDILELKLDTELRRFGRGRDGGIDLVDNLSEVKILVQVKHYINSTYSDLKTSLKKEIPKVKKIAPNQYYVCCSKTLTPDNIKEVYSLFSEYMDSDENILTLIEIDEILQKPANNGMLSKHFKLWLSATNILSEINNQAIFIDCQMLLASAKEDYKYYVQTSIFNECKDSLEKSRAIIIVGAPGVGKTITSKMLILHYAANGYRVRYTTNGNINDLKNAISRDKETKEIILLDDCLGQYYFSMNESQETELIALIRYVNSNKNKRLILNSRVTIYNEAKERTQEFDNQMKSRKIKLYTVKMSSVSDLEKARIFYNHLLLNRIPTQHYKSIKTNKNYRRIIKHRNYNPRIIEFATFGDRFVETKPEDYFDYIMLNLNNPKDVWKNEFERKLQPIDRIFMNILFSLTDTTVNANILEECFNKRIKQNNDIDTTINNFDNTLARLNKSLVHVVDNSGKREIGPLNPSINDYMSSIFYDNKIELSIIKKSLLYLRQLERCYKTEEIHNVMQNLVESQEILNINSIPKTRIQNSIIYIICTGKVCVNTYKKTIHDYLENGANYFYYREERYSKADMVEYLTKEPLCTFYDIKTILKDFDIISKILSSQSLEDQVRLVNKLFILLENELDDIEYEKLTEICCEEVNSGIEDIVNNYEISDFFVDYDFDNFGRETMDILMRIAFNDETNEKVLNFVEEKMRKSIEEDINLLLDEQLYGLREEIGDLIEYPDIQLDSVEIKQNIIDAIYTSHDYDDDKYDEWRDSQLSEREEVDDIDMLFDKDIDNL